VPPIKASASGCSELN
jgi:3D (Asp-Asp-Asp) domain-containing protein